jgi:hypothetical protein
MVAFASDRYACNSTGNLPANLLYMFLYKHSKNEEEKDEDEEPNDEEKLH